MSAGTKGLLYDHCLNELIVLAEEKERLISLKLTYEKINSKGYIDISILKELNEKVDFKSKASRLAYGNLIYMHIHSEYDETAILRRNTPPPSLNLHKN